MESAQKRFVLGVLLALTPWVPTLIGLTYVFRDMWGSKATGLTAVAGGISESLVLWGLLAMIVSQVLAMVWLFRSLSRDHVLRSVVSTLSLSLSILMLAIMGVYVWLTWFVARR